jgi:hypothetical protein
MYSMKSPEEETPNGSMDHSRPASLPPLEEVIAKRDKDFNESLKTVNGWVDEARRRGIPLHDLIAEMNSEKERTRLS